MLVTHIRWGDHKHKPSFWPDDIVPWAYISNPVAAQKYKLPRSIPEVMKIAIYRCLMGQGIDPRSWVSDDVCQIQIRNKLRTRSLKTLDEAYERWYSLFMLKTEPQEVKQVPDESFDQEEATEQSDVNDVETFEYSDDDIMSDEDENDVETGPDDGRAAAISNILNILANE